MFFVFLGCLVFALIFLILSEVVHDYQKGGVFSGLGCAFAAGWLVCLPVVVVLLNKVPLNSDELEYRKEIMEIVVETADFESMSDENLEIVAKNVVEVNQGLSWYREHENTFWYYSMLNKPKDKTEIKIENPRFLRAVEEIIDAKNK